MFNNINNHLRRLLTNVHNDRFSLHFCPIYGSNSRIPPPPPRWYYYFVVLEGLAWSKDPEGYAGGSVANGRASHAGQVKGEKPDETGKSRPPGRGLGVRPTNSPRKNSYVEKPSNMPRRRSGYKEKGLIFGTWNVRTLFKTRALPFTKVQTQRNSVTEKWRAGAIEEWRRLSKEVTDQKRL